MAVPPFYLLRVVFFILPSHPIAFSTSVICPLGALPICESIKRGGSKRRGRNPGQDSQESGRGKTSTKTRGSKKQFARSDESERREPQRTRAQSRPGNANNKKRQEMSPHDMVYESREGVMRGREMIYQGEYRWPARGSKVRKAKRAEHSALAAQGGTDSPARRYRGRVLPVVEQG